MDRTAPMRTLGCLKALLLGLALHLATVSAAAAHAVLLATEPADRAVLETPPREITVRFNEPVAPVFVRLIGPNGQAVPTPSPVRAIDTELRLPLPTGLIVGGYLVSYRVVSADSHPVAGSFAFWIGTAAGPAAPSPGAAAVREECWQLAKILLRFVQDIALMLAAGSALFQILVLPANDAVRGLVPIITGGAAIAILAAVLGIAVQGGLLAIAPASAFFDPEIWRLGASTSVGTGALVLAPALTAVALGTVTSLGPLGRIAPALGALAAAASLALTGHSATAGWPAQMAVMVHAITVAYWLGALWPLYTIVRTRPPGEAAILVRRFSALAVPAVALLIVAGVGTALTRIDHPAALLGSEYGRTLLLKLALVALLLALAAINRWRVMPALAPGSEGAAAALGRNIRLELALAGTVLLVTAVLAHTAPPQALVQHDHHDHAREATPGYAVVTVSRGRTLLVEIAPARAGANALTLWLSGADGQPFAPVAVTVALSMPAAGIEPLVRVPERTGDGRYALTRVDLPTSGRWSIRVDALISDFEKVIFTTKAPIR